MSLKGSGRTMTAGCRGPLRTTSSRLLEATMWPFEVAGLMATWPLMATRPVGDDHPVLILPGFTADDRSTVPLRWMLRGHGYWAHAWRLGQNIGPTERAVTGMRRRMTELHDTHGRRITLVGWSLGGIYARVLAREKPELVRQVISLGSPYRLLETDPHAARRLWDRVAHLHDGDMPLRHMSEQERPPLTVPATSIYSRTDGVAPWQTCIDEVGARAENIEVVGSHVGMGLNPAVLFAILDRLAQPEADWRPFNAPLPLRPWYPKPASWRDPAASPRRQRSARR